MSGGGVAERYRRFAEVEAAGRSEVYERLAVAIADDERATALIAGLPAVKQQASATRDIAGNVNSAALCVHNVSNAIAKIEAEAAETAMAAARFTEAARKVSNQSGTIRDRVRFFTADIQNATRATN